MTWINVMILIHVLSLDHFVLDLGLAVCNSTAPSFPRWNTFLGICNLRGPLTWMTPQEWKSFQRKETNPR